MKGKKIWRKENWKENIILSLAWLEEGKHGGKKTEKKYNPPSYLDRGRKTRREENGKYQNN